MVKKRKFPNCKFCNENQLIVRDNHTIGCLLENYAQILRFRGFEQEANQLDGIGARLK